MDRFSYRKHGNSDVQCGRDGTGMDPVNQFQVNGIDTFTYNCPRCGGRVSLQMVKVQDGRGGVKTMARQVQLTGDGREFMLQPIRAQEEVQIPVAYTIGTPASKRVMVEQAQMPAGIRMNPDGSVSARDFDPRSLRERLQPVRLSDLS